MVIAFIAPGKDAAPWRAEFRRNLPDMEFQTWPDEVRDPARVQFAVVWQPPAGTLRRFSNLRGILSMGAGVDHLLSDPDLPSGVPIVRLVDRALTVDMTQYVVHWVIHLHRSFHRYPALQREEKWERILYPEATKRRVGVMGLGNLGRDAAAKLTLLGFAVQGWSRSPKTVPGVRCLAGEDALDGFLAASDILVCLLPLTQATRGIVNARTLGLLPAGAFVINAARGAQVVDHDLIAALDSGHLAGAVLDVFDPEPLPAGHPFWRHPKVIMTPHMASYTTPRTAAQVMAADIRRILKGERPDALMGDGGY